MAVLKVKNLTKKFNKFTAVDNIFFELREGEILGLLGPNGAGKTTTIDMLLGLTKPTTGEIEMFGLPFEKNREKILQQMNFSAAYVNLPWRLKVWENLYTFARLYEVDNYKEKVEKLMEELKIKEYRNYLTEALSSGQLTRLYLCKAFVNEPRLLLLDEPTAFLDPDFADLTRKIILERVARKKTSVLFTSHNMAEVTEICDRVIFLNHGKIVAEDTPSGLARKIESCRVKLLFIGNKEKIEKLLTNYEYQFQWADKELFVDVKEENVGQLLGRFSLAKLKYSQITIEKPTLEDFFINVVRQKV